MKKKLALALISLSILLSACTSTLGDKTITVTLPHNDCGTIACTTETQTEIISVR